MERQTVKHDFNNTFNTFYKYTINGYLKLTELY